VNNVVFSSGASMAQQTHAANTAMTFLFHAERQWRGVADGHR